MRTGRFILLTLATAASAFVGDAAAGTVSLRWDAVPETDVAGYRVYFGATAGAHTQSFDAKLATSADVTGATDCAVSYFGVRAYDASGLESPADSSPVRGFPRPSISSVSASTINQGETKTFTVTGLNFDAGVSGDATRPAARARFSNSGLTVTSFTVTACGTAQITVTASATAATGAATLTVENPDLTYSDPANHAWVYADLANALTVASPSTAVVSASPASGASGVAVGSKSVQVVFNRSLAALWTSLSASERQKLFRVTQRGRSVAQASGSPSVSADGLTVTITLSRGVASASTYITSVGPADSAALSALSKSGIPSGALGSGWTAKWTTASAVTLAATRTSSTTTAKQLQIPDDPTVLPQTNTDIPVQNEFTIAFAYPVSSARLTNDVFRVVANDGSVVPLAGLPKLENNGQTVVLHPAAPLAAGKRYRVIVRTGDSGVLLVLSGGALVPLDDARPLVVPLATKVSSAAQSLTLSVAP